MLYSWKYSGMTGLDMVDQNDGVKVYPVPASDRLNINLETEEQGTAVLYALDGKILLRKQIAGEDVLDVSNLRAGTYILQVSTNKKNVRRTVVVN